MNRGSPRGGFQVILDKKVALATVTSMKCIKADVGSTVMVTAADDILRYSSFRKAIIWLILE
jgi:hypothetical protein